MRTFTAAALAAGLIVILTSAGLARTGSAHRRHTHSHHSYHSASSQHRARTNITISNATVAHSGTPRRHGRGVYGGVYSQPTISNNGQAAVP